MPPRVPSRQRRRECTKLRCAMMGTFQSNILDSRLPLSQTRPLLRRPQMRHSVHVQHFSKKCSCHRCENPLVAFFFLFCFAPLGRKLRWLLAFLSLHTLSIPVHVTASAVNLGHRVRTNAGQQRPLFSVCAFHLVAPKSRGYGDT